MLLNFLQRLDTGFYFPVFCFLTCPITAYFFGFIACFFYLFVVSLLHSILLYFYPYVKHSDYYLYLAAKKTFFLSHEKIKGPFSNIQLLFAKIFLLLSFYYMYLLPEFCIIFFPFQFLALIVVLTNTTVEVINIIQRPKLLKSIRWSNPLLQRRYGPITDIFINKVIPLCIKSAGTIGSSYVVLGGGYKALNGIDAIDPIRCFILNKYHGFPKDFIWDEPTVIAWRRFNLTEAAQEVPLKDRIKIFVEKNKDFSTNVEHVAKDIITSSSKKN